MTATPMTTTTVTELWRFPVKSMGGGRVDHVRVDTRGVHADRLWAVRDLDKDITATARRIPALLGCSARYADEPGPDAGPGNAPPVVITLPDGSEHTSDDPRIHALLSEVAGRPVRLTALPPADDTSAHRLSVQQSRANFAAAEVRRDFGLAESDPLPDTSVFTTRQVLTLARFSTPPGTFVDLSPVHLLSTNSLSALSADGTPYDVRRFRPNILVTVEGADSDFPEAEWTGATLQVGSSALHVTIPTIRCAVPTRPQPGVDTDRALGRRLSDRTNRFLGVYVDVTTPGTVRIGDVVSVHRPTPPGALQRAAAAAGRTAKRRMQQVLEATVLRGQN
ncbi:MOSC N-terminal beta barrel domain-containing protein [Mycobacterium sp. NPDC050551]|uniref:MOSC domain-containing protein n=1 Tax=Mycobacterium sp. NPDC050551 TaxID=3155407 RepID=UPI00343005FC